MSHLQSRSYQTADPKQCCEKCVFGSGQHAAFCQTLNNVPIFDRKVWDEMTARARRQFQEDFDPGFFTTGRQVNRPQQTTGSK